MHTMKKLLGLLVFFALVLAGCATAEPPPPPERVVEQVEVEITRVIEKEGETVIEQVIVTVTPQPVVEPDQISIWNPCGSGSVADWAYDPVLAAIEQATNTDIEMIDGEWGTDQINQYIASGELPDIIGVMGPEVMPVMTQWIGDGVLAAYEGDVAAAAPNVLEEYDVNPTLVEMEVDGKAYFQPIGWGDGLYPNMGLIHVRKDLLDKYGMEPPDTFEDYFDFLQTCKDAGDGNGVVAGLGGGVGPVLSPFAGAYDLPMRDFVKVGDHFEYYAVQPGILDALLLFREMETRGLIAPESWEGVDPLEAYETGEYCSQINNGGGHTGRIQNAMALIDESMQNWLLPAPTAGAGSRGYTQEPMFWGTSQLGNMEGNNPVAAARVINYLISDEGYKLTSVGIEGRDYEVVDGEIVLLEQRTKDGFPPESGNTQSHPLASCIVSWQPEEWQDWALLYGHEQAWKDWFAQMWENQGMYQIPTYGSLMVTPTWGEFLGTSNDLMNIAFVEVVKADSEEDAAARFQQFVDEWMAAGGAEAQTEMSDALVQLYAE